MVSEVHLKFLLKSHAEYKHKFQDFLASFLSMRVPSSYSSGTIISFQLVIKAKVGSIWKGASARIVAMSTLFELPENVVAIDV